MNIKFICPLITVANIEKSRRFYENILNQKVKFDFGENITFEGDFAIHLQSHFQNLINLKEIIRPSNSCELYFESDEIDELFKKLKSAEVVFVHEMREQPWRQKVARFYDPDYNLLEVGESMESLIKRLSLDGMSCAEIISATGLPEAFVKATLN